MIPQIIILVLVLIELMLCAYKHNKSTEGIGDIGNTIAGVMVEVFLFIWGGFFSVIDYPQIIYIFLRIISLLIASNSHGKHKKGKNNFWIDFIRIIITLSLLYWADFFNHLIK